MSPPDTTSALCLSDFEIANLIAGQLQGEARERALRHLAECEDCYEIFVEAQAFLADDESVAEPAGSPAGTSPGEQWAPPESKTLPFTPRMATPKWFPWAIAAGLLIGIALAWLIPDRGRPPAATVASWSRLGDLPPFASEAQALTPLPTHEANRGIGDGASQIAFDFRLGAEWAHFAAAVHAGATEEAQATAMKLRLKVRSCVESEELTSVLGRDLESLLGAVANPSDSLALEGLGALTSRLSTEMATLGYEFDLGRFAEAGRLAAEAAHWKWFTPGGEAAHYLREIRAMASEHQAARADRLAPEARRGLEAIAESWPSGAGEGEVRFREAAKAFEDLILAYDEPARNGG